MNKARGACELKNARDTYSSRLRINLTPTTIFNSTEVSPINSSSTLFYLLHLYVAIKSRRSIPSLFVFLYYLTRRIEYYKKKKNYYNISVSQPVIIMYIELKLQFFKASIA